MADDVTIPKLGSAPKKIIIPVVVAAAGYIGYRYWKARNGTGADAGSSVTDGEFGAVDSSIPGVLGAVSPTNSYGDGGNPNDNGDPTTGPGHFKNNAEWTNWVADKLVQSEKWSYTDIVTAIGNGLAGRPVTTAQQDILRAAIAVGGQPPEGAIIIVPGGNTNITIAPGNARLQSVSATSATIAFDSVSGAAKYTVYRSGGGSAHVGVGSSSPVTISGLTPGTTYTMNVAATSASGVDGPRSNNVTVKTPAAHVAAPSIPTLVKSTGDSLVVKTTAVAGATGYRWLIGSRTGAVSQGTQATLAPLSRKTKYSVSVRAMIAGQPDGPASASRTFSTK